MLNTYNAHLVLIPARRREYLGGHTKLHAYYWRIGDFVFYVLLIISIGYIQQGCVASKWLEAILVGAAPEGAICPLHYTLCLGAPLLLLHPEPRHPCYYTVHRELLQLLLSIALDEPCFHVPALPCCTMCCASLLLLPIPFCCTTCLGMQTHP